MEDIRIKSLEDHEHHGLNLGAILMGSVSVAGSFFSVKQLQNPSESVGIALFTEYTFYIFLGVLFLIGGLLLIAYPLWDFYFDSKNDDKFYLKINKKGIEIPSVNFSLVWEMNLQHISLTSNDAFGWTMTIYKDGAIETKEFDEPPEMPIDELEQKLNSFLADFKMEDTA
ncbi:hypothetical protein R9C00_00065 [Flammeovirgaceae bacterium SG7u.111]|nr:hypothetical protein [Flammeovirgaceae bacterium SG7u.132]WPO35847.1 hypothetical protein R9C00_00065 [Flammeovirgaceae bacterium SG7u.111]